MSIKVGPLLLKKLLILSFVCMVSAPILGSTADTLSKGPVANLSENVFEFQPVMEGSLVTHTFVLNNPGAEPLKILDIKSG